MVLPGSRVVPLALLVLLAGCGSYAVGSLDTPTVTPAPVPSDQPVSTAGQSLPPGLSETGITNVTALRRAHARVLSSTSFTRHTTLSIQYLNGTELLGVERTLQVEPADDRFSYREVRTGSSAQRPSDTVRVSIWSTGDRVHRVAWLRNGTVRNTTSRRAAGGIARSVTQPPGTRIPSIFGGINVEVVEQWNENGMTVSRVAATDASSSVLPLFPAPHGSAELRAEITETGLVRHIVVEAVSRRGRLTLKLHWTIRYSAVGETSVSPPARDSDTASAVG